MNRLVLDATLSGRDDLRYTPAGVAAIDCMLAHRSVQSEAGGERRVDCELHAVAFGDIATSMSSVAPGTAIRCEGFLARRYRTGITLSLHITRFKRITEDH
ncbi:MAG TPA: primosomal replication protein N [Casimicrobiaceae bacterium]|nr:primosomal replication protein N [Casimicrobiaceae bacterium]